MVMAPLVHVKNDQLGTAGTTLEKLLVERNQVKAACAALEKLLDKDAAWQKQGPEPRSRAEKA